MVTDIRAVVFDFGGVLFDWNPEYLYGTLIPDPVQRRHFLSTVCTPAWNVQQDGGRTLDAATAELISRFPEHEPLIRAYYDRWIEMLRGTLDDGLEILKTLHRRGVPLFGLTNWSSETFPHARRNYPFLGLFRDIVVSGEELCVKPEEQIFRIALERFSRHIPELRPENLVFIDDNEHNVIAARSMRWNAIHHTRAHRTAEQLRVLGLPV
jgi:2-haloacid dehalogenase